MNTPKNSTAFERATELRNLIQKDSVFATEIASNPIGNLAKSATRTFLNEAIDKDGFIPTIEKELQFIADVSLHADAMQDKEGSMLMSVISMFYTMVNEYRIQELYNAFTTAFPDYYPEEQVQGITITGDQFKQLEEKAGV